MTTAPDAEAALVSLANAEGTAKYHRAWPATEADHRMAFLGDTNWEATDFASVRSGNRDRDERYSIEFECWSFGVAREKLAATIVDAYAIYGQAETAVASNAKLDDSRIYSAIVRPVRREVIEFEKGYAAVVVGALDVYAYLEAP